MRRCGGPGEAGTARICSKSEQAACPVRCSMLTPSSGVVCHATATVWLVNISVACRRVSGYQPLDGQRLCLLIIAMLQGRYI
jgi:hypothetical protein